MTHLLSYIIIAFGTVYYPSVDQCDSTPFTTADMTRIECPEHQRIIAVSYDLEQIYPIGSTVYIDCDGCEMEGIWHVHDRMNERYAYCSMIDFLVSEEQYKSLRVTSFESVKIYQ